MRNALAVLIVVGLGTVGCGDSEGSGGGSSENTSGSGSSSLQQSKACKKYVECTSAVAPSGLGPVLDAYGPDGTCWGQDKDLWNTCNDACVDGTNDWASSFPDEQACWGCVESADCEEPTPACDQVQHQCVSTDMVPCGGQCTADAPMCYEDPSTGSETCVAADAFCFLVTGQATSPMDAGCMNEPACIAVWGPGGPCSGAWTGSTCDLPDSCLQYYAGQGSWPPECSQCGN